MQPPFSDVEAAWLGLRLNLEKLKQTLAYFVRAHGSPSEIESATALTAETLEACLDEEPRQYLLMTTQILSFLDRAAPMIEDKSPNLLARLNRESRELHESAAALEFLLNASIARLPEEPAARTPESREHAPPSRELDTLDVFEGDLWLGGRGKRFKLFGYLSNKFVRFEHFWTFCGFFDCNVLECFCTFYGF